MGRWGWFVCVRSQSRPPSTHLRKGHSEWRRLGGTCRGLAGPRYPLYLRVPGKVSHRFRSSVVVSHGLPLYPSVDRGDLSRGIGQSVADTLCRHKAPNPFAGRLTNPREIFLQIQSFPVHACPRSCLYANWAGLVLENGKPRPPATYAVRRPPVRNHGRSWGPPVGVSPTSTSTPPVAAGPVLIQTRVPLQASCAVRVRTARRISIGL